MSKETSAAVPVVTALIAQGVPYSVFLLRWLLAIRAITQQTSEWSPKMEEDFINALILTATEPKYSVDAALAARP
jgi:hypothetical protein